MSQTGDDSIFAAGMDIDERGHGYRRAPLIPRLFDSLHIETVETNLATN